MPRTAIALLLVCVLTPCTFGARTSKKHKSSSNAKAKAHVAKTPNPVVAHRSAGKTRAAARRPVMPLFDPTAGDNVDGDDLAVRRAAVDALGSYNGTVVAVDPQTGRILTIVNQKTALESGFTPCSTIKLVTAFAALNEGLVERDTPLKLTRRTSLDMSSALAHSNNPYFKILGDRLGFERAVHYAQLFGLGEKAGWHIEGERPGALPEEPFQYGGVGMMTAFGEGVQLTPLELAAMMSAIANGGTLYYLQYPRTQEEIEHFVPRVKRQLSIGRWIDDVKVGMRGAVEFGTGHRAGYDSNAPLWGKTGTCHDSRGLNHLGWFGSFNDVQRNPLVVVVLLTGGFRINGPIAAGVAGSIYKQLSEQNFFAQANLVSTQMCCTW